MRIPLKFTSTANNSRKQRSSQKNVCMEIEESTTVERSGGSRQEIEAALRTSEERYRALFDDNPSMYFTVDTQGAVLSVNRFGAEQLGYTVEALTGQSVLNVFHEEDQAEVVRQLQQCIQNPGQVYEWEFRKIRRDGKLLWVKEVARAVQDASGQTIVLIVCEDITARKLAEQEILKLNHELEQRVVERTAALRESEEKFRQLAENIQTVFWMNTPNADDIVYISPGYEKIWGRPVSRLFEKPLAFLDDIHPEDLQKMLGLLEIQRRGEPYEGEYRIARPDGSVRWIYDRGFPIANEHGEVYRYAGIAEDISASKNMEAQLRQYATDLEALVDERTRQIRALEKQHIENEKLAATGRMAARIAHEINNPLGFIQIAFKLISRDVSKRSRYHHYLDKIEKEIDRIARIIRQMLDLHKPHQEAPQSFRPEETIRDVLVMIRPHANERGVAFDLDLERARASIALPENMLRQILYNIIINAVEASLSNSAIKVAAQINERNLTITVIDTGPGIPEDLQPRIFEPFFTTKTHTPNSGMGLGLSICKSLIEAMNGVIKITSHPGEGTACQITLPLQNEPAKVQARCEA